jgi:hypothetical protein
MFPAHAPEHPLVVLVVLVKILLLAVEFFRPYWPLLFLICFLLRLSSEYSPLQPPGNFNHRLLSFGSFQTHRKRESYLNFY